VVRAKRTKPGEQAIAHDGRFIRAAFYWGMRWPVEGGGFLISRNPFGAPAPGVKSAFVLPKNRQPLRPVADDARFAAVRAAAELVTMDGRQGEVGATLMTLGAKRHGPQKTESPNNRYRKPSYLPELLDLVWWQGRRRGAVVNLWYSDFLREGGELKWIRWRPVKHTEEEEVTPIAPAAREAIKRILAQRPGEGDRPVFPSPRNASRVIALETVDAWLRLAEEKAGVGHLAGGLWHPYRRAWNTKRRHYPVKDRMRLAGWKTAKVMQDSYEHPDDEGLLEVLEQPKTLIERSGP
jgi:integrase